jgi:glycosyltransferase involved in cell wall biosynthesis
LNTKAFLAQFRLLAIVPAFNEEATVLDVVTALRERGLDVLVVDDCSIDNTAKRAVLSGAKVIRLPVNLGVGGALRAGFRWAIDHGYDSVVQVDADGQHPTHQISDLVHAAALHDAQLVIGSRYLSQDATLIPSAPRRFSMWCLSKIASRIARQELTDTTSGFRLIRQPLLQDFATEFPDYYLGDTYEATIAALRAGYRVIEVPAALSERQHGTSSTSVINAILLIAKVILVSVANLHPRLGGNQKK